MVNNTVVSNHFHSVKILLFSSARSRDFDGTQKLKSICAVLTFDPQLKKILTFSVKDRYQLNYFICIKDFNAETNTSLKLNCFLSLFASVNIIKGKRFADSGVPNTSIYSAVSLASPYYNYL